MCFSRVCILGSRHLAGICYQLISPLSLRAVAVLQAEEYSRYYESRPARPQLANVWLDLVSVRLVYG